MRRACPAIDRWFVRWCGVNFVSILTILYTSSIINRPSGYSMRRYNIKVVVIIVIIPFGMGGGGLALGAKILVDNWVWNTTPSLTCLNYFRFIIGMFVYFYCWSIVGY